jgi:hypothetical protein
MAIPSRVLLWFVLSLLFPPSLWAWNPTGHEVVARIAWDTMNLDARTRAVALLASAPRDACLVDLMAADARPLAVREREFFVQVSTWADIVRPGDNDTRPCTRFSRADWHYINYFWQGASGAAGDGRPTDRSDIPPPTTNAVAQLPLLRAVVACTRPQCGTRPGDRAIALAWILHLVGDIHQPLHTSGRITARPDEQKGDQGGNLFLLQPEPRGLRLHGYWDSILDRSTPRHTNEAQYEYVSRLANTIMQKHPRAALLPRLRPAEYEAWAREGLATTKATVYPVTLKRGELPSEDYRALAFAIAQQAIARAGYRLGDLLNRMFED